MRPIALPSAAARAPPAENSYQDQDDGRRARAYSGGASLPQYEGASQGFGGGAGRTTSGAAQISRRPVEIAEQIVNNLMPLLDVLHDVAAGTDLGPASKQRAVVEEAIKTLPVQLKELLDVRTGLARSGSSSGLRTPGGGGSVGGGYAQQQQPPPQQQYQPAAVASRAVVVDDAPPPSALRRSLSQHSLSISQDSSDWREQPQDWFASRKGGSTRAAPEPVSPVRQVSFAEPTPAPAPAAVAARVPSGYSAPVQQQQQYESEDPAEARMKAEIERQRRIKEKLDNTRGQPPPNFNLMMSTPRAPAAPQAAPEVYSPEPSPSPAAAGAMGGAAGGGDWRSGLRTKKQIEEEERRRSEQAAVEADTQRFQGMPEWKRLLILEKERKKYEAEAPMREAQRQEAERQARFNSLPEWKQKLLAQKMA